MVKDIREPRQKRSIEKKDRIIAAGWKLFTLDGYYHTNTKEIAKEADVSTGIVYQYFTDKHDILIAGIEKYGDDVFFPLLKLRDLSINKNNIRDVISSMIQDYINSHKISKEVHEEIMAMVHIDDDISKYFYEREMNLTFVLYDLLNNSDLSCEYLKERIHIMIGLIDNLCHEIVYHKHDELNYDEMIELVVSNILKLFID